MNIHNELAMTLIKAAVVLPKKYYDPESDANIKLWIEGEPVFVSYPDKNDPVTAKAAAKEVCKKAYGFDTYYDRLWARVLKENNDTNVYALPINIYSKTIAKLKARMQKIIYEHYLPLLQKWVQMNGFRIDEGFDAKHCIY